METSGRHLMGDADEASAGERAASRTREAETGARAHAPGDPPREPPRIGYAPPSPDAFAASSREPSASAAPSGLWQRDLQWIVAALAVGVLAWLTYSRGGWVPLLSDADLAIHEFGHLVTRWAPPLVCSFFGSFLQVAVPLALGGYFWWRKDQLAVIVCGAWAAESLNNVSVYIADAQRMVLPLFGDDGSGAGHDWHNILRDIGWLDATDSLASAARVASICLFIAALALAVRCWVRARRR